jgi:hypothetical protein
LGNAPPILVDDVSKRFEKTVALDRVSAAKPRDGSHVSSWLMRQNVEQLSKVNQQLNRASFTRPNATTKTRRHEEESSLSFGSNE